MRSKDSLQKAHMPEEDDVIGGERISLEKNFPLTHKRVKLLFEYCPQEGLLLWRARPQAWFHDEATFRLWNTKHSGKPAGAFKGKGYLKIRVHGVIYCAQHLIYLWWHGIAAEHVAHINGQILDNRIANLIAVDSDEKRRSVESQGRRALGESAD